ncbi:SusC/RagA family TonB-linked outer membrane protein [Niabella sp.]|uniref:SusC/RagA family TonB-linked outer membrane protein n=1 Tax=Niabella sp. TaxID=1962976 RepID=UPI0026234EE5|nr:SusC/RagA family TonB-linked outer membrane protein [Niabella sp.]
MSKKGYYLIIALSSLCLACTAGYSYGQELPEDSLSVADSSLTMETSDSVSWSSAYKTGILPLKYFRSQPYVSIQQMVKGNVAGVYVQEPSGEPGTEQYMFIRGLQAPLLSKKDLYAQQPTVFVNGIPLIPDNNMVFDIQVTDYTRIGPATNFLSVIDSRNIESIKILKDPADLARLGPIAANGAIWITTKNTKKGSNESFASTYFGYASNERVTPVNAAYEAAWRKPFYDKYASPENLRVIPTYLRDIADGNYYGPANWTDLYYQSVPIYSASAGMLLGKHPRANVALSVNHTTDGSGQDNAKLKKSGFSARTSLKPFNWMTFTALFNGTHLDRYRNRSFRERLSEVRYTPSLSSPLPPNKAAYQQYLDIFSAASKEPHDDNQVNALQAMAEINADLTRALKFISTFNIDYNENTRDAFWPRALLEKNNFTSNYFGYNQRVLITNAFRYAYPLDENSRFTIEAGQSYQSDVQKYDYGYGYNTPNDNIKVRPIDIDPNKINEQPFQYFLVASDKQRIGVSSIYGSLNYSYKKTFDVSAIVRRDGGSFIQPDKRWITSPILSASWNLKDALLKEQAAFSNFVVKASYGVIGMPYSTDYYSKGPIYVSSGISWPSDPVIPSYIGSGVAARPYSLGWVSYGVEWQKAHKANLGLNIGVLNNRVSLALDIYNNDSKNLLLLMPAPRETGYSGVYKNGMAVNNRGIDATIEATLLANPRSVNWVSAINVNFNKNKLTALPDGKQSVVIGNRLLKVGESIDGYWLLQNQGIYNTQSEIPVKDGRIQTFNGIALSPGDPKWKDNGDNIIDENDKVLTGHSLPVVSGGFINEFSYKQISLSINLFFAAGQKLLNQEISNRLNFANNDNSNNLSTVKEITYWQKNFNPSDYPLYNPWSNVDPFQSEQDLFLQNASFVKLRAVTLSYRFGNGHKNVFSNLEVYLSGTNLFTVSPFKNGDPELVNYQGYYTGYAQRLPRTITLGARVSFKH